MIRPAVGVGFHMMAAMVIAAIDQRVAYAGLAHLAEGDLLLVGHYPAAHRARRQPYVNPAGACRADVADERLTTGYWLLANRCDGLMGAEKM
jgi:hypothetical protein